MRMPEDAHQRAIQICNSATDQRGADEMVRQDCRDGVSHSYELMTYFDWSAGAY